MAEYRDIPITLGEKVAAAFADPNNTDWITITGNNISINSGSFTASCRSWQSLGTNGTIIDAVVTVEHTGSIAQLSYNNTIGLARLKASYSDDRNTTILITQWSGADAFSTTIPTVGGVVYVRIALIGTQLQFRFSGSPIGSTRPVDYALPDQPDVPYPTYLTISGKGIARVEHVTLSGLDYPVLVYTVEQQIADFGEPLTEIDIEMWQVSPNTPPDDKGFSVREVFP